MAGPFWATGWAELEQGLRPSGDVGEAAAEHHRGFYFKSQGDEITVAPWLALRKPESVLNLQNASQGTRRSAEAGAALPDRAGRRRARRPLDTADPAERDRGRDPVRRLQVRPGYRRQHPAGSPRPAGRRRADDQGPLPRQRPYAARIPADRRRRRRAPAAARARRLGPAAYRAGPARRSDADDPPRLRAHDHRRTDLRP